MKWEIAFYALLVYAIGVSLWHFVPLLVPFPLPDRGFRIFSAADEKAREVMLEILAHHGLTRKLDIDTARIKRTLLSDKMTVINAVIDLDLKRITQQRPAIALVASDPAKAAEAAVVLSRGHGYPASVLGELDPDAGPGNLVFIETELLPGQLLVFRKHILWMPRPGK